MNYKESFKIGLNGLRANIMRTGLTMLGIIFGVAAVISMLSIGEGAKQETLQQIELLGTNNIIINKKAVENTGTSSKASYSLGLTTKDLEAIKAIAPDIQIITPVRESKHGVMYKSNLSQNVITGTSTGYPMTFNSKLVEGTFFKEYHQELRANVCVIGSGVKERLFKYESPLNKKIKIGEMWFSIIGVVAPKSVSSAGSQSFGIRNFNEDIYIPLNTMLYKFTKVEVDPNFVVRGNVTITNEDDIIRQSDRVSLDQIIVKVDKSERLKEIAALTGRILDRRHFGVKDYEIVLPEQLLEQKQKTQRIFNIVMGAIAGISLLVGGLVL